MTAGFQPRAFQPSFQQLQEVVQLPGGGSNRRRRRVWVYDEYGRRVLLPLDSPQPVKTAPESEHERARRLKKERQVRALAAKAEHDRQLEQEREDIAVLTLLLELVA